MNTVYLDVLIAENTLMNFVILHITAKITSHPSSKMRLLIGAAVGTVYAVLALFIETFFTALAGKLLLSAVMVFVVFTPKCIKDFFRFSLFFYAVTFLFAGLSFALVLSGNTKAVSNVLITACMGYLMIEAICKFVKKQIKSDKILTDVYIQFEAASKDGGGAGRIRRPAQARRTGGQGGGAAHRCRLRRLRLRPRLCLSVYRGTG